MSRTTAARCLQGITVLDFTWAAVGPYATFLLRALGADVIRIESPLRSHLRRVTAGFYADLNAPKTSVLLDVTTPRGVDLALRLAEHADVAVDNYRAGVMERLGLGEQALRARNPRLVVVSATAMGATGPEAAFGGYAPVFSALGGLAQLTGYPDAPPTELRHPVDFALGALVAAVTVAALLRRQATGRGTYVDLSCREGATQLVGESLIDFQLTGRAPERAGNDDAIMAPHGVYPARGDDEWVSVAVSSDEEWCALARAIGRPELADDPSLGDAFLRWQRRAELDDLLTAWTRERPAVEAATRLQEAGVAAAPSLSARGLFEDEHLAARRFASTRRRGGAETTTIGVPWRLSGMQAKVAAGPGPAKARQAVFGGLLGLSPAEIRALRKDGVIG
ncbi:MAG TPA: CoA transferase [Gaiellaceae bacterium]|nr:CoA transferase [Gaiellaceae bacterium]